MATYIINNQPQVRAYYAAGDMPSLRIMRGNTTLFSGRGSSLGPRNPRCNPDESDIAYWRALAGLPADDTAVAAAMERPQRIAVSAILCPRCGRPTGQAAIDALGQCCDCEDTEAMRG